MIFVTVGTHEQQFNRLIEYMDNWAFSHKEDVFIQTGYSTYQPKFARSAKILTYQEMQKTIDEARIIITHGGPSSFIAALQRGKTPIVVPRQKKYKEHVNNHQVEFCQNVEKRLGTIIVVEDIESLGDMITNYKSLQNLQNQKSNNEDFCRELELMVDSLFSKEN